MLADRTLNGRFIPLEADSSNRRCSGWRVYSWHGLADFHSPTPGFHSWFCALFGCRHRFWCVVHDLQSPVVVLRNSGRSGFLPDQFEQIKLQTSLEVARDRVIGILFGLCVMWLVFDRLWGVLAAREMIGTFISNLRLIARFAREPVSGNLKAATARRLALRETINTNLDKVRALADGVLLEFGRSREQDLAMRDRIRRAQPQIRVLFMQIAEWKYRAQLPGFELPQVIALAQREFDDRLAESLDRMADGIEGRSTPVQQTLEDALAKLDRAIQVHRPTGVLAAGRLQALLVLGRRIESSMVSLTNEIGTEQLGSLTLR
jgi:multidrug resistance protein MdtO